MMNAKLGVDYFRRSGGGFHFCVILPVNRRRHHRFTRIDGQFLCMSAAAVIFHKSLRITTMQLIFIPAPAAVNAKVGISASRTTALDALNVHGTATHDDDAAPPAEEGSCPEDGTGSCRFNNHRATIYLRTSGVPRHRPPPCRQSPRPRWRELQTRLRHLRYQGTGRAITRCRDHASCVEGKNKNAACT